MKEFGSNGIVVDSMVRLLHHCRGRQRAAAAAAVVMISPWRRQIIGSKTCVHVYRKAPNRKGDVKEKKVFFNWMGREDSELCQLLCSADLVSFRRTKSCLEFFLIARFWCA
jgi:hypothetical protein